MDPLGMIQNQTLRLHMENSGFEGYGFKWLLKNCEAPGVRALEGFHFRKALGLEAQGLDRVVV